VVVVDGSGRRIGCHEEGEITVSSRFLSPGYWRDEELTRMHFKKGGKYDRIYFTGDFGAIDSDGRLIYLGRKDNQVKVRGYRVNLDEIEAALRSIEGISECAVVFREDPKAAPRIVAYLERNGSSDLKVSDLRKRLESLLPVYMIPSLLFYMDHLPVAPNGKLDRSMLSSLNCSRPELNTAFQLPETETERFLCGLLSETLGVDPVGSQDNLFEMGVDSIIIFQLIGRIQNVLHIDIGPALVFASPVIADLARKLDECLQVSRTN
jgi:aryl carrier-like protein